MMSALSMDEQASSLPERRNDVRLAVLETNFANHLNTCATVQKGIDGRLSRIEKGIIGTVTTLLVGGATIVGILLKILLHLG